MHKRRIDLSVLTLLFFTWGFVTCLNDILIPHLKGVFALTYVQAALVQFTFFAAYFILALPSGAFANRFGYQQTMVIGLVIAALGAVGFVPAAMYISYPMFLAALFAIASGITLLQVAANPYVLALGEGDDATRQLNLTQAFNALGTTVAPIIGGIMILGVTSEATAVVKPYLMLAAILLVLAAVIYFYRFPKLAIEQTPTTQPRLAQVFSKRHTVLGAVAIFLYVGAEVSIGSFLVNYLVDESQQTLTPETAAHYVAFYWGGAMVGRFIGSALMRYIAPRRLFAAFTLIATSLIVVSMSTQHQVAMVTLLTVGLFNSIMFPTIFALGVADLGTLTSAGSSLLVMAIVGGAIVPMIFGVVADHSALKTALAVPIICYLYLFYYAWRGADVRDA